LEPNTRPVRASGTFEAFAPAVPGPLLVAPRRFRNGRGFFLETWSERDLRALAVDERSVQDNHSQSAAAGAVRGMHFQEAPRAQAKPVRVLHGAVLDVAVDLRPDSPAHGRHAAAELSAADARQVYVPAGFAHGFCTLRSDTEVAHKASDHHEPSFERGLAWDDPDPAVAGAGRPRGAVRQGPSPAPPARAGRRRGALTRPR